MSNIEAAGLFATAVVESFPAGIKKRICKHRVGHESTGSERLLAREGAEAEKDAFAILRPFLRMHAMLVRCAVPAASRSALIFLGS
jgi:hypothetical protein